jgi:SH3-like domain-containing protein
MMLDERASYWHGESMRGHLIRIGCGALLFASAGVTHAADSKAPRWGSISAGKALMRTGPGRNFPAIWEYRRQELPVKVIESYPNWRKVIDPDGATGWIQANLLSETHTAVVRGGDVRQMHAQPNETAPVAWRVEAGVVGRVSECGNGWCKLDVKGRAGYIEASALWGVE